MLLVPTLQESGRVQVVEVNDHRGKLRADGRCFIGDVPALVSVLQENTASETAAKKWDEDGGLGSLLMLKLTLQNHRSK